MDRDTMIETLTRDYECYVCEMTDAELELIIKNQVFTLRSAQELDRADRGM